MILAIDTATRWTGVALHDGDAVVAEYGRQVFNTQTVELAPTVAEMLTNAAVSAADLKAIAVAIGPGSYTGLRVGLGFAKGIALAHGVALIGVSTLDIVAAAFGRGEGVLVPIAEAGRKRVCAAPYEWSNRYGWRATESADIYSWDDLLQRLDGSVTFAGEVSADARKLIRNSDQDFRVVGVAAGVRRAGYLAEIGWRRLRRNHTDDAAALTPVYLRDPAGNKVSEP
ncbi:MAG: tRNA (adenosine(37)-N6)-threonylcarbamoyltransferase complex dimerization subunit type 1 TsaB [Anaerolineae bacterium]|nr:tRNA (adenosine(37)-N6)-threonylcarbamoyltransferase complex dimerization subunit type 1 TsaB [Anaerolineae bacterium]MCO5186857.1 tRNA (adenosine(37)-N6)-threonylcarbamoyltransferase complex dimerization subunit type 1 TsaB [Anaerolineae bacterium]MCO5194472.1 tRNA (adenosine(37)-N6)-threonylcarbamoyltransferase complex dimerization subunit type 1 TsaB [Anaerolineae bacterium]MCO5199934.1 tRNA (adenosine(37)-N6)-threonylcarbamoyltransferase complex dimerization subunit type 1 TsaB [Anaerolin